MNLKIKCITCVFLLLVSGVTFGGSVEPNKARSVATNWYRHYAPASKKQASITKIKEYKWGDRTSFYICSFDKGGFVLVSANDAVTPVLGYGFDYGVPDEITNEAVKSWFDNYARQIDTAFVLNLKSEKATKDWEALLEGNFTKTQNSYVEPLLTTTWDQGWPYNAMCPEDLNGPGGHTQAGCVAIALAQIMKFHEWPLRGAGNLRYVSNMTDSINVNFSEQSYSWMGMPNTIDTYNEEVAKLIFNTGVSVGSHYGPTSTGVGMVYSSNSGGEIETRLPMESALSGFFRYNYDSINAYVPGNDSVWISFLKTEIDKSQPIYYQGNNSSESGHAWVCDGYNSNDFFHFNFGWGGYYNGYYTVVQINPGGDNFNSNQLAITGIFPDTNSFIVESDTSLYGIQALPNNTIIPRGITLTLTPGTQLKVGTGKKIIVFGVIKSLGSNNNPIVITSADTNLRWNGIYFNDEYLWGYNVIMDQDTIIFNNTEISNILSGGMSFTGLYGFTSTGLLFGRSPTIDIDHCNINNNLTGLFLKYCTLILTNSIFNNNNRITLEVTSATVDNNIFNGTVIRYVSWDYCTSLLFSNNNVIKNSGLDIWNTRNGAFNFKENLFYGNSIAINVDFSKGNFVNNLFVNNDMAFSSINSSNYFINNTFSNNGTGLSIASSFAADTLLNNILYNNGTNLMLSGNTTPYISHCIIENGLNGIINQTPYLINQLSCDSIFDGCPDFVNPSTVIGFDTTSIYNHSWNLGVTSAAIDMARSDTVGLSLSTIDLDDNPRFTRTLDVGAYESLASPTLAPVVVISPQPQTTCVGSTIILSTYIKGDSLQFEWFFNSTIIPLSNNDSLVKNNLTLADTGNYYCVAYNTYGRDTTLIAHINIIELPSLEIGEIQGPDTITWWQKSVSFCVDNQLSTLYSWNILGNVNSSPSNCRNFMPSDTDSSGLIKVNATNICGMSDSLQKSLFVKSFTPPEPYGILFGPSVIHRNQAVQYILDIGNYDIISAYNTPEGCSWIGDGRYFVNTETLSQTVLETYWLKYGINQLYQGEHIFLPITIVDSASQLPYLSGPDSISSYNNTITYSIDSLRPASSYEWIWPEGLLPVDSATGRIAQFTVTPAFTGGIIQVRGINSNWRGPYYSKNLYPSNESQQVTLSTGWNIASFYVHPQQPSMDSVLSSLIVGGSLVKVINEAGGFIQNIPGIGWLNTVGDMQSTEGYYIKMDTEDTLSLSGAKVNLPFEIPLQTGWNIMGYPVQESQDALNAIQPIINSGSLTKVINESGGFIQNIPGMGWLNTIGDFEPGEGYYIKVSSNDTLAINDPIITGTLHHQFIEEGTFYQRATQGNPYLPMHIVANFNDNIQLVEGDELAVFAGDQCLGSSLVEDFSAHVAVFLTTDDPTTEIIDGGQQGDMLIFKLLHQGKTYLLECQNHQSVSYESLETQVVNFATTWLDVSTTVTTGFEVSEVIPNPFSSEARIYVTIPETGNLKIEVLDLRGVVIKTLFESEVLAQKLEVKIEGKELRQGMYFIHVRYKNENTQEEVLRKVVMNER